MTLKKIITIAVFFGIFNLAFSLNLETPSPLLKGYLKLAFAQVPKEKTPQNESSKSPGMETLSEPVESPKLPKRPKTISLETLRLMETIEKKSKELKKREEELRIREAQVKALEAKVRGDLEKIEQALKKSQELIGISQDLREENLDNLVKIYSSMRPQDAAPLIATLDEKIAIQIISKMKSKIAGQVMSQLDTKAAKKISEKIVGSDIFNPKKN